jgi:uncharacterized protein (DUF983 family)
LQELPTEARSQHPTTDRQPSRLLAMLDQRCPRCLRGPIFQGQLEMHARCPECGLQFGREPGYFTGAMWSTTALAIPLLAVLALLFWGVIRLPAQNALIASAVSFALIVPLLYRFVCVVLIFGDYASGDK